MSSKSLKCTAELPPTRDALEQHVRRSVYVAGYIWGQAAIDSPQYSDFLDRGWYERGGEVYHLWTNNTLDHREPLAALLKSCACVTKKCETCTCAMAGLACYHACKCRAQCSR